MVRVVVTAAFSSQEVSAVPDADSVADQVEVLAVASVADLVAVAQEGVGNAEVVVRTSR